MAGTLSTASSEKGDSNQRVLEGKTKAFEGSDLLWVGEQSLGGLRRSVWTVTVNTGNRLNLLFLGCKQKTVNFSQLISSRGISNWLWLFLHSGWKKSFMTFTDLILPAAWQPTRAGSRHFLSTVSVIFLDRGPVSACCKMGFTSHGGCEWP